ncbi:hypothetical protein GWE_03990 [Chlamydia psittaci NJ1]|nr:hypothetical protein B595_0052 [Chlamydia psittaci 84/55]AFS20151.1 hypothetical protein B598_0050 [Chlamydia psittaci GR9]AFS21902.1 hypothetical protein B599_0050 [Chlamydia psittaci MN]AFS22229.1 hypothetical protein B600_0052 [Chlamydia psittaci VS225]AFS24316.1 hypothetical protein B601_0048 [Chlamydia psittaci WS/RT/E30]AFS24406.1 hypothetical protein B602_0048 [Chlamydia psittaci M56]AFS25639.1 hypothetical protein B603_0050 [Chlamydia psittaci WC]AFS26468.1 hypothetical protein B7
MKEEPPQSFFILILKGKVGAFNLGFRGKKFCCPPCCILRL